MNWVPQKEKKKKKKRRRKARFAVEYVCSGNLVRQGHNLFEDAGLISGPSRVFRRDYDLAPEMPQFRASFQTLCGWSNRRRQYFAINAS